MDKITMNLGWERSTDEHSEKVPINLPDDFIINLPRTPDATAGIDSGFFPGGRAIYTKKFFVPEDWDDKQVLLDIDGALMSAEVFFNGEAMGIHPYGYAPWQLNLTNAIIPGEENTLKIITRCIQPNSRWYSGGGLYRAVNIWVGSGCHIRPWDLFVTTPDVTADKARVHVSAVLTNSTDTAANGEFCVSLCGQTAYVPVSVPANSEQNIQLDIELLNPDLWSAEEPHLHLLNAKVSTNLGEDSMCLKIGIRSIDIDAENGLRINGNSVKLLGGCIHHDNTLLGAAAYPRAEQRKIELLKAVGYNAVRTAHNPPSTALLEACDELGMYVMVESFDSWQIAKKDLDYHLYFRDWWERDTTAMVLRDRNHPSVFCWSVGNEVCEMGGMSEGAKVIKLQTDLVKSLDPTRPVTAAFNLWVLPKHEKGRPPIFPVRHGPDADELLRRREKMKKDPEALNKALDELAVSCIQDGIIDGVDLWGEITESCMSSLDVVGYNYIHLRYGTDGKKFPGRVIIGTETHSSATYDYFKAMMDNTHVVGDFIWTAYDNLGEAGAGRPMRTVDDLTVGMLARWPWLSCYQGDLDLDGNRRPQSYYRKIMWGKDKGVYVFAQHPKYTGTKSSGCGWHWSDVWQSWTWPSAYEGKDIEVEAYADCDEVEFILNDKSLGKVAVVRYKACITIPYIPGTLKAVAWKNGNVQSAFVLETAGSPAHIELIPDRETIVADGIDLCYVQVKVTDECGITVPVDDLEISVSSDNLAGIGSGNPCTDENYGTGKRRVWNGLALICLRSGETPGKITLSVTSPGLPESMLEITTL